MNWVDAFFAIFFFAIFKLTSNRGIIQEITEIITFFAAGFLASHTYFYLIKITVKLTHQRVEGVSTVLFILAFILFALLILAFGSYLDLAAKSVIDPKLDKNLGDLLCAFKSFMIIWILITIISAIPLKGVAKKDFYSSAIVKTTRKYVNPTMDSLIKYFASKKAYNLFHDTLTKEVNPNEQEEGDKIKYDKF